MQEKINVHESIYIYIFLGNMLTMKCSDPQAAETSCSRELRHIFFIYPWLLHWCVQQSQQNSRRYCVIIDFV